MKKHVLLIQGAGAGAYEEDALLAASLQDALGSAYEVAYPRMPEEDSAEYRDWTSAITAALAGRASSVTLVGHSVGGSVLLKMLYDGAIAQPVDNLFVIAAPFWGADAHLGANAFWKWDEAQLPENAAARLANIPRIFFYHNQDDEFVPFAHFQLYEALLPQAALPQAVFRALDEGGHQFRNDLSVVASDIKRADTNQ